MYNSDTVYSTTTFRPVSPSPRTADPLLAPTTPSPQRTRKLETPLHFDGGLFSDIRSQDGKLLSKVTVDRIHSASRHDVTDSPTLHSTGPHGNADYVDNITKTETITNEDVIKIKFTPVRQELDVPRLLTPSQFVQQPIEYIKDDLEDLQSYKMVNLVCKENRFDTKMSIDREKSADNFAALEPSQRPHTPLANFVVSEQMTKIDEHLQKSLDVCSMDGHNVNIVGSTAVEGETKENGKLQNICSIVEKSYHSDISTSTTIGGSYQGKEESRDVRHNKIHESESVPPADYGGRKKSKTDNVQATNTGVLSAIYNMPIHYHAALLCFLLIVYNLIYQYIKQNCHGGTK